MDGPESGADGLPAHELLVWRTATVGGRVAAYGVAGSGPPLVFLHGWAVTNRTYKAALKRLLQQGVQVWAPALPGFGGTEPLPEDEPELGDYAAWLDEFLRTVGLDEPAVLIGHSFGGAVAIRTAHDFPDRARALVLLNSIGGSAWRTNGSVVRALRERPLWDWGLHFTRDLLPIGQVRRVLPVILHDVVTNAIRNPRAVMRAARIARDANLTDELEDLRDRGLPVVVLWGEEDRIVTRASIEAIVKALGDPHVISVSGSHSWLLADPDEFGEVMTNVLALADEAQAAAPRRHLLDRARSRKPA